MKRQLIAHSSKLIAQSLKHAFIIICLSSLILAGFIYGILGECDLRDLKYSDAWWTWQHDRALAEHYASREQRAERKMQQRAKSRELRALNAMPYALCPMPIHPMPHAPCPMPSSGTVH